MDRKQIEEKDLMLTSRLREIVHNKDRPPENERRGRPYHRVWLSVLCAGLMILAGAVIFREPPPTVEPTAGSFAENIGATAREKPAEAPAAADAGNPAPKAASAAPAAASTEKANLRSARDARPNAPEAAPAETDAVPSATAAKPLETPPEAERSAEMSETVAAEPPRPAAAIQIEEIVSCSSVSKRRYVAPRTVFSLKKSPKPFVWMNVLSEKQPFTLTHVYYLNGRKYCAVPLEIRHPRMRTWSNVTLRSRKHSGKWRVAVMTGDGRKLEEVEFTVVP
jgi:hypothetical protein